MAERAKNSAVSAEQKIQEQKIVMFQHNFFSKNTWFNSFIKVSIGGLLLEKTVWFLKWPIFSVRVQIVWILQKKCFYWHNSVFRLKFLQYWLLQCSCESFGQQIFKNKNVFHNENRACVGMLICQISQKKPISFYWSPCSNYCFFQNYSIGFFHQELNRQLSTSLELCNR